MRGDEYHDYLNERLGRQYAEEMGCMYEKAVTHAQRAQVTRGQRLTKAILDAYGLHGDENDLVKYWKRVFEIMLEEGPDGNWQERIQGNVLELLSKIEDEDE